jgi:protein-S-isoprenylcysteine O-methyltransferase Ste14
VPSREELDRLWADPAHWRPGGEYHCPLDPRLMVLKRVGAGWTANTAHPMAVVLTLVAVLVALAPLPAHIALGTRAPAWLLVVALLTPIAVAVLFVAWLNGRGG